MKRKLIDYDVFKQIERKFLQTAEKELNEACDTIASALGKENMALFGITENEATFATDQGTLVHATYLIDDSKLLLENIEELVVDESSQINEGKNIIDRMVDSILDDNKENASDLFSNYFSLPYVRVGLQEGVINEAKGSKKGKMPPQLLAYLKKKSAKKGNKKSDKREEMVKKHSSKKMANLAKKASAKVVKEWSTVSKNILDYVDFRTFGAPTLSETVKDKLGNVVSVAIPRSQLKNEAKMLAFNWKTLNTDVMYQRDLMRMLAHNIHWGLACKDMKKCNGMSDASKLQETVENVVAAFPSIIYLTEGELAKLISDTLVRENVKNFDDETCIFLAEGVLRTCYDNYKDKVNQIYKLADMFESHSYEGFKQASEIMVEKLDEVSKTERMAFEDAYKSLNNLAGLAEHFGETSIKHEIAGYMGDIENALVGKKAFDLNVLEEAAAMLKAMANLPMSGDWHVSDKVGNTVTGDIESMSRYGKIDGSPGKYASTRSPFVSNGKDYDKQGIEDLKKGYLTHDGADVYPNVKNPYVPKAGDYKIHGEKTIESDSNVLGHDDGPETWDKLKNPYIPSNGMTLAHSFKLLKGSERG
jgi:Mg2+ and Co2+ transporter CorA